jgi:hypothetical protein
MTRALNQARARTAGPGREEWQSVTITDITPLDTADNSGDPQSPLLLTATTQDGTELTWHLPAAALTDNTSFIVCLLGRDGDEAADYSHQVGETLWIQERPIPAIYGGTTSVRCDTSGRWLLESAASRRKRQTVLYRWGRAVTTALVFLDATIGMWRLIIQLGLLLALAIVFEPAWAILLGGITILACQEVALLVVDRG